MAGNVSIVSVGKTREEQLTLLCNGGYSYSQAEAILNQKPLDLHAPYPAPTDGGEQKQGIPSARPKIKPAPDGVSYSELAAKSPNPIDYNGPKLQG